MLASGMRGNLFMIILVGISPRDTLTFCYHKIESQS